MNTLERAKYRAKRIDNGEWRVLKLGEPVLFCAKDEPKIGHQWRAVVGNIHDNPELLEASK